MCGLIHKSYNYRERMPPCSSVNWISIMLQIFFIISLNLCLQNKRSMVDMHKVQRLRFTALSLPFLKIRAIWHATDGTIHLTTFNSLLSSICTLSLYVCMCVCMYACMFFPNTLLVYWNKQAMVLYPHRCKHN